MTIRLTVYCEPQTFDRYWYGYGTIESSEIDPEWDRHRVVVDYGDDDYHARYQEGRFASGLIFAKVEEI